MMINKPQKGLIAQICKKEKGIALMIVLWIMVLLIVMTLAFSVMVRTEVFSTITFKEQLENKYLAEAGLQRAMLEIIYRNANINNAVQHDETDVYPVDGTFRQGKVDDGYYRFAITDESGKININLLTDASGIILNNLLVNLGVEKNQADTIVDSLLDWKDEDDLHRLHGAESDYYMSLPKPYKCKDANFDNLEELLLVQGMTPDILYGTGEKPGLIQFLTVHTSTAQININTAKPEVLKAIPAMTDDMVQTIINYRTSDNGKKDGSGLQSMLSADYATIAPYITTADSRVYSVEVIGFKYEKTGGYPLKAMLVHEGTDRCRIVSYQSPAHIEMPKNDTIQEHL